MHQIEKPQRSEVLHPDVDQLELKVQAQLSGRIRRLHLILGEGGLVLHGSARTYHAKQLAQHVVMKLTTLPIFANEIDVA